MSWPETIHCHRNEPKRSGHDVVWRPAETVPAPEASTIRNYRHCSYCGSIHPLDLLEMAKKETFAPFDMDFDQLVKLPHMEMADLKYGYPHKVYVTSKITIFPDHDFVRSTSWVKDKRTVTYGKGTIPFLKFYTQHLDEPEASDGDFAALKQLLEECTGFSFDRDAQGLLWKRWCRKINVPDN